MASPPGRDCIGRRPGRPGARSQATGPLTPDQPQPIATAETPRRTSPTSSSDRTSFGSASRSIPRFRSSTSTPRRRLRMRRRTLRRRGRRPARLRRAGRSRARHCPARQVVLTSSAAPGWSDQRRGRDRRLRSSSSCSIFVLCAAAVLCIRPHPPGLGGERRRRGREPAGCPDRDRWIHRDPRFAVAATPRRSRWRRRGGRRTGAARLQAPGRLGSRPRPRCWSTRRGRWSRPLSPGATTRSSPVPCCSAACWQLIGSPATSRRRAGVKSAGARRSRPEFQPAGGRHAALEQAIEVARPGSPGLSR